MTTAITDYTNAPSCLDAYKVSHHEQYPQGTELIVSNLTPRASRIPNIRHVVFFGLQSYIQRVLLGAWKEFFDNPEPTIEKYQKTVSTLLNNPNYSSDHLKKLAKLGYLPICIKAVKEGTKVPLRVPVMTIHNTHPDFFWLPNFLETQISDELWGMCTSATIAAEYKKMFLIYASITGSDQAFTNWQAHDFSMRGMWGIDAAAKSGAAHLLSGYGTDTIPAIHFLQKYYGAEDFVGGSVPATEHSVMCAGGETNEEATFSRLLDTYPTGILSVVSDTWDFWNVVKTIIPNLKDKILSRNGKLVIRPDSGDPVKILCGDPQSTDPHIRAGLVECLWNIFGGTTTKYGYRQLDSHIGCIYGDSITLDRQYLILEGLRAKSFASSNVVLGVGSFTYQFTTRDTFGWAIKATAAKINGVMTPIFKKPKTDDGTKNSAKGLIKVVNNTPQNPLNLSAMEDVSWNQFMSEDNLLENVFVDGKMTRFQTLQEIRGILGKYNEVR